MWILCKIPEVWTRSGFFLKEVTETSVQQGANLTEVAK